jgi:hypothetical protein
MDSHGPQLEKHSNDFPDVQNLHLSQSVIIYFVSSTEKLFLLPVIDINVILVRLTETKIRSEPNGKRHFEIKNLTNEPQSLGPSKQLKTVQIQVKKESCPSA